MSLDKDDRQINLAGKSIEGPESLPSIRISKKSGREKFQLHRENLPIDLLDFWKWSSSDIVGNALRGVLAEFIVASALGETEGVREEWDAYDLKTRDGIKIEVKSGAYIQSWKQDSYSRIVFSIRPTLGWDARENRYSSKVTRQADVYVFCVLKHKDQETIDPLNLDQWDFYVMSTEALNCSVGDQKTISLSKLLELDPVLVDFDRIDNAIKQNL